jgi:predicted metalloprotease with PDZ domain
MIQKALIALCLMCAVQPAFAAGRGYLGVWFGDLPATEKVVKTGVIVNKVFAGSAAEQSGLKPGEIVTRIDGVLVRDPKTAVALVSENTAGEKVSLTVIEKTGGEIRESKVVATLAANPPNEFSEIMTVPPHPFSKARHCAGAGTKDRPCRAAVPEEH